MHPVDTVHRLPRFPLSLLSFLAMQCPISNWQAVCLTLIYFVSWLQQFLATLMLCRGLLPSVNGRLLLRWVWRWVPGLRGPYRFPIQAQPAPGLPACLAVTASWRACVAPTGRLWSASGPPKGGQLGSVAGAVSDRVSVCGPETGPLSPPCLVFYATQRPGRRVSTWGGTHWPPGRGDKLSEEKVGVKVTEHFEGLAQDSGNSSANTLGFPQPCAKL